MTSVAEQSKARIAGLYDRAAGTYDRVGPSFFTHFGERLVDVSEIPAGGHVLDIGTGTGVASLRAAQRVGGDGLVVGIDLSLPMLRRARERLTRARTSVSLWLVAMAKRCRSRSAASSTCCARSPCSSSPS